MSEIPQKSGAKSEKTAAARSSDFRVRDQLISVIQNFEADTEHDPEDVLVNPLVDGNYYCNLKLLGGLCNLIAEKFGEENAR